MVTLFLPLKLSRGIIIAAKIGWSGYGQLEAMVKQELITDSFTQAEDRTIDHWCVIHTPYLSAITPKNYRRWSITFQPCYYFHFFLKNWLYGFSKERRCDNEEMSKNERLVQLSDKPNANSLKYAVSKKILTPPNLQFPSNFISYRYFSWSDYIKLIYAWIRW